MNKTVIYILIIASAISVLYILTDVNYQAEMSECKDICSEYSTLIVLASRKNESALSTLDELTDKREKYRNVVMEFDFNQITSHVCKSTGCKYNIVKSVDSIQSWPMSAEKKIIIYHDEGCLHKESRFSSNAYAIFGLSDGSSVRIPVAYTKNQIYRKWFEQFLKSEADLNDLKLLLE